MDSSLHVSHISTKLLKKKKLPSGLGYVKHIRKLVTLLIIRLFTSPSWENLIMTWTCLQGGKTYALEREYSMTWLKKIQS